MDVASSLTVEQPYVSASIPIKQAPMPLVCREAKNEMICAECLAQLLAFGKPATHGGLV